MISIHALSLYFLLYFLFHYFSSFLIIFSTSSFLIRMLFSPFLLPPSLLSSLHPSLYLPATLAPSPSIPPLFHLSLPLSTRHSRSFSLHPSSLPSLPPFIYPPLSLLLFPSLPLPNLFFLFTLLYPYLPHSPTICFPIALPCLSTLLHALFFISLPLSSPLSPLSLSPLPTPLPLSPSLPSLALSPSPHPSPPLSPSLSLSVPLSPRAPSRSNIYLYPVWVYVVIGWCYLCVIYKVF